MKTVFINGSPKKKLSVSSYLLGVVRLLVRGNVVKENVRNKNDHARILQNIKDADAVVFGVPLYVDGVPSHVLGFMKEMENFCKENNISLKVYVVSNGGFIEGNQNRPLLQVFENFSRRSGLEWGGGVGIGGGVMLNVYRIMFFVYIGSLLLNILVSGIQTRNWLPVESLINFAEQMLIVLFFNIGVFIYGLRMGVAIKKGNKCGEKYTRAMLPSFVFIIVADIFFTIISIFKGGFFRGWFSKK